MKTTDPRKVPGENMFSIIFFMRDQFKLVFLKATLIASFDCIEV